MMDSDCRRQGFAAFSVDVEDYFQVEALRAHCPRETWGACDDRIEPNVQRLLDILESREAKATFFVLGWIAARHPAMVRRIAKAGHEIASHGHSHELVYRQAPEAFRADVRRARSVLEDLSGKEVVGYRAPSYTIMKRTMWALEILSEEGYRYDSSVFPIPRRRYGMPEASRWPHEIMLRESRSIVEFPLPSFRIGFINLPVTGGAYLRLLPFWMQKRNVHNLIRSESPFVVNVHPWELDPEQPRFPVGARTRWTHYHNLERTEGRIQALLSLTSYASQGNVLRRLGLLR